MYYEYKTLVHLLNSCSTLFYKSKSWMSNQSIVNSINWLYELKKIYMMVYVSWIQNVMCMYSEILRHLFQMRSKKLTSQKHTCCWFSGVGEYMYHKYRMLIYVFIIQYINARIHKTHPLVCMHFTHWCSPINGLITEIAGFNFLKLFQHIWFNLLYKNKLT